MTVNTSYVEVYIWRGKDREGYTTTSTEGIKHALEDPVSPEGPQRCGHVSMGIFRANDLQTYISLWPGKDNLGVLVPSLENDQSPHCEGTLPDVIVRLHHLKMDEMVNSFNQVKARIENNKIFWKMDASDHEDVTNQRNTAASCSSFVWTFLKVGGLNLNDKTSPYYRRVSLKGPNNREFYNILKCNLGQILCGWFDGAFWTKDHFTPYALCLRVGSVAEGFKEDKEKTIEIMKSDRVAKEKIRAPKSKVFKTLVRAKL